VRWNVDVKAGALTLAFRVYADFAAMHVHDALGNVESKARAASALQLVEVELYDILEKQLLVLRGDTRAIIMHFYAQEETSQSISWFWSEFLRLDAGIVIIRSSGTTALNDRGLNTHTTTHAERQRRKVAATSYGNSIGASSGAHRGTSNKSSWRLLAVREIAVCRQSAAPAASLVFENRQAWGCCSM
jgi:hypothetical protein